MWLAFSFDAVAWRADLAAPTFHEWLVFPCYVRYATHLTHFFTNQARNYTLYRTWFESTSIRVSLESRAGVLEGIKVINTPPFSRHQFTIEMRLTSTDLCFYKHSPLPGPCSL